MEEKYKITYIGNDGGIKEAYAYLATKEAVMILTVLKNTFGSKILKAEVLNDE